MKVDYKKTIQKIAASIGDKEHLTVLKEIDKIKNDIEQHTIHETKDKTVKEKALESRQNYKNQIIQMAKKKKKKPVAKKKKK